MVILRDVRDLQRLSQGSAFRLSTAGPHRLHREPDSFGVTRLVQVWQQLAQTCVVELHWCALQVMHLLQTGTLFAAFDLAKAFGMDFGAPCRVFPAWSPLPAWLPLRERFGFSGLTLRVAIL